MADHISDTFFFSYHHTVTVYLPFAVATLVTVPLYAWLERRHRPAWDPVEAAPVAVGAGSYRDGVVRPLVTGRAPALVRLGAFVGLAHGPLAAWRVLSEVCTTVFRLAHAPGVLWLATGLVGTFLHLGVDVALASAGLGLLRRAPNAPAATRRAAVGLLLLTFFERLLVQVSVSAFASTELYRAVTASSVVLVAIAFVSALALVQAAAAFRAPERR